MKYGEAAAFVMPWGQYKGLALDKIAEDDEGLLYLGWLHGEEIKDPRVRVAVRAYLEDPTIAREYERVRAQNWRKKDA